EHVAQCCPPAAERGMGQEELVELALDAQGEVARRPSPAHLVIDVAADLLEILLRGVVRLVRWPAVGRAGIVAQHAASSWRGSLRGSRFVAGVARDARGTRAPQWAGLRHR